MKCTTAVAILAFPAIALAVAGCSDEPEPRSEGRYCTEVGNHLAALNSPALAAPADIDAMLDEWRTVAGAAPIAIQQEWDTMMNAMETAATVDPNDTASVQLVADTARASEPAANRVIDYTFTKCNATIGEVTPVVTVPPSSTPTTLPAKTQPATTQPATTQPATTQPATTQPATTQPATTLPATTAGG